MGSSDGAGKPEASLIEATETEDVKPEDAQKVDSSQTLSEPPQHSTPRNEEDAAETLPEKVIQRKELSDGMKTQDREGVKEMEAQRVKEQESVTQGTQIRDNEQAVQEESKKASDASKLIESIEETNEQKETLNSEKVESKDFNEQKEKVNSEDSKEEDIMPIRKPEAVIEREDRKNDINEANRVEDPSPEEEKDDDSNRKQNESKGSHSQADNNADDSNAMEIDTEPKDTGSEQTAPQAASDERVPMELSEQKENAVDSAGDASPMEVDSKPDAKDTKLDEEAIKPDQKMREEETAKRNSGEKAPTEAPADGKETLSGKQVSTQNPVKNSGESAQAEKKTLRSASRGTRTTEETTKSLEKGQRAAKPQVKGEQGKEEQELSKHSVDKKESASGRPRRSSTRNTYQARTLRPRTSGRVHNTGGSEAPAVQEASSQGPRFMSGSTETKQTTASGIAPEKQGIVDEENTPRPTMEANGLVMRIDEAVFVTEDQLDELKVARLTDKKVKPFEHLTFQDLRTYNRDQLRAYCFAYGMARRKKTEMEADMARYLSYWNRGREGFALHEYVPTSSRVIERVEPNPADSTAASRAGVTSQAGHTSREGSATPTTSNGRASASAKPSSSRGATPSRSGGPAANSARVSGSQGSSALSSGGPVGAPTSTGNSQVPGSTQAGTQRTPAVTSRAAKPTNVAPILPRGFGTSFKQRVHARQAGAKFKAAYNGAGPAIVNIVENAAAYFEGKDSPEVILDQAKSYERYQFNVDMLSEIFDGVPDETDGDVEMTGTEANEDTNDAPTSGVAAIASAGLFKRNVLDNIASRVASGKRKAQATELNELENQFKEMEESTKYTERTNMRLFQRLERAETKEQIESVRKEFEAIHNIKFDESNPPPLVRRKLDKTLPPFVMSDEKCRILRFKVS